jgi:hypothetical protein
MLFERHRRNKKARKCLKVLLRAEVIRIGFEPMTPSPAYRQAG